MNEFINLPKEEKYKKCRAFFDRMAELMKDEYTVVASCNQDLSAYLVPKGTENEITYYGKPDLSIRVSDHWSWYSNLKRCKDPEIVQCWSANTPRPRKRDKNNPEMATRPRTACQVCLYEASRGKYYCFYGEYFDKKKGQYIWVESNPEDMAEHFLKLKKNGGYEYG